AASTRSAGSGRTATATKSAATKSPATKSAASKSTGAASKSRSGAQMKDDQTMLRELFMDELRDIYWAEKHLTKALPKMMRAATSGELKSAFERHITVTEEQISRLEEAFEMLGEKARAIKCEGMEGLVKEGQKVMEEMPKGTAVRDAGLIISAQKIEHYEIAAYGSLVQLSRTMGNQEMAELLQQTLDEEKEADQLLTELAVSGININAESESE
ncbi:MAG TPA: ferritin-like domain-containing protein, partial [Chitinophagaceae bacterium]|nr:ferritin-like domain-containing protein [Chitinophagaceae bacterium]